MKCYILNGVYALIHFGNCVKLITIFKNIMLKSIKGDNFNKLED